MARFIQVRAPSASSPEIGSAVSRLDPGERDALLLAYEIQAPLLVDEQSGRSVARSLKIDVVGVAGLLIRAKHVGLISAAVPRLEEMRERGYWLSDALIETARRLSGENE